MRHNLKQINIFSEEGNINELGGEFAGQHRFKARSTVEEALKQHLGRDGENGCAWMMVGDNHEGCPRLRWFFIFTSFSWPFFLPHRHAGFLGKLYRNPKQQWNQQLASWLTSGGNTPVALKNHYWGWNVRKTYPRITWSNFCSDWRFISWRGWKRLTLKTLGSCSNTKKQNLCFFKSQQSVAFSETIGNPSWMMGKNQSNQLITII